LGPLDARNGRCHLCIPASIRPPNQYGPVDLQQKREIIGRVPYTNAHKAGISLPVKIEQNPDRLSFAVVANKVKETTTAGYGKPFAYQGPKKSFPISSVYKKGLIVFPLSRKHRLMPRQACERTDLFHAQGGEGFNGRMALGHRFR
jgi:hypothetical protein